MTNAGSMVAARDRHPESWRCTRHWEQPPTRIVAVLAAVVKHLLPGAATQARQAAPGPYRRQGSPPSGWLGGPPAQATAPIGPLSSGNTFRHAFYRGLTLP